MASTDPRTATQEQWEDLADRVQSKAEIGSVLSTPSNVAYVGTNNIVDGAVTADKIDFATFPHVVSCGTDTISAIGAGGISEQSIIIPTQKDTNYHCLITLVGRPSYWTWIRYEIEEKTTTSFKVRFYNDGSASTTAGSFDYIVARND